MRRTARFGAEPNRVRVAGIVVGKRATERNTEERCFVRVARSIGKMSELHTVLAGGVLREDACGVVRVRGVRCGIEREAEDKRDERYPQPGRRIANCT